MPSILFITAYPPQDASCRHRVHSFLPYLQSAGYDCTVSAFASDRLFSVLNSSGHLIDKALGTAYCGVRRLKTLLSVKRYDLIVIHREAFPFLQPTVEHWIFARHSNVVFSFDDAVYAGHENASEMAHPWLYRWKHRDKYESIIRRSRLVIAGNRILADYARKFNPRVTVVPTVVDCNEYYMKPITRHPVSPIVIGWIGSRSTAPYISLVTPVLQQLALTYSQKIGFRFIGAADYKIDIPGAEIVPFDLAREIDDLHSLDIGIMPLADSAWARGKCAFKAIQYMATGAAAVASPVGVTTDLIQNGWNGFLADSEEEWFRALSRLIEDTALRQQLVANAKKTIEQSYSLSVWGPRFVRIFDQILAPAETPEAANLAA